MSEGLFDNIAGWSSQFTGEQNWLPKPEYRSKEYRRVKRQLRLSAQLIALIGSRGIGKSTMLAMLERDYKGSSLQVKWDGLKGFFDALRKELFDVYVEDFRTIRTVLAEAAKIHSQSAIIDRMAKLNGKDVAVTLKQLHDKTKRANPKIYWRDPQWDSISPVATQEKIIEDLFSMLPKEKIKEMLLELFADAYRTLLIDFFDYGVSDQSRILKDINGVQELWAMLYSGEADTPNLVFTWQEELLRKAPHFWFNKCHQIYLQPVPTRELFEYFKGKFDESPFSDEIVMKLATRAQGNFRNFMKLVFECVTGWQDRAEEEDDRSPATEDEAEEWTKGGQVELELRLAEAFPNSPRSVRRGRGVVELLKREGDTDQPTLTRGFYMPEGTSLKTAGVSASRDLRRMGEFELIVKRTEKNGVRNVWGLPGDA